MVPPPGLYSVPGPVSLFGSERSCHRDRSIEEMLGWDSSKLIRLNRKEGIVGIIIASFQARLEGDGLNGGGNPFEARGRLLLDL